MATKKKPAVKTAAPAKKAAPAKVATKPVAKAPVKKTAPAKPVAKQATPTGKTGLVKKLEPAKKAVPTKPAASVKKAVPAKKETQVKAPVKKVAPAKVATAKMAPKKPVAPAAAAKKVATKKQAEKKPVKVVVPPLSTKRAVKYSPAFKSVLDKPKIEKAKTLMRYSDADLQEFKEIILRKLDAAKKELAYLQGLITRRDDEAGDADEGRYMTMEDGSVSMEREQLSQLASRQISFIDHLEKALMRVENKTYGICRVTGNLIEKARLRAVPHATLSMEAKSGMNR